MEPKRSMYARLESFLDEVILARPVFLVTVTTCLSAAVLGWHILQIEARQAQAIALRGACTNFDIAAAAQVAGTSSSYAESTVGILVGLAVCGLVLFGFLVRRLNRRALEARELAEATNAINTRLASEVAERKRAEDALAAANERLTATHATVERWAAELEIANTRLREVDELKTKFLSEVSHELRSPMAAICSAAKIITKHHTTKPEVVGRFGRTILSEGGRLTRLINEFLDLTKVESGCVEWKDAPCDPTVLVREALLGVDSLAVERDVTLDTAFEDDLPDLFADRDRLFQVLTNLLNNALKYTPEGGTITVHVTHDRDGCEFAVADTGPGIPADELVKVFDRFHQVRVNRQGGVQRTGTGLGLCICREIVEHYGGRIWADSTLGEGSSFKFTVPGARGKVGNEVASVTMHRNGHCARVLLVLDEPALAERALDLPATGGIECRACDCSDDLPEILAGWRPDAVVVSSTLIQQHGQSLLQRIQCYGVENLLVHSPEHGLTAPSVLDSSDMLGPSLRCLVGPESRVLVVEDDERFRGILEFELTQAGYDVITADDGRSALSAISKQHPDAMVLDLVMPGMDGLTLLEQLRERRVDLPVLVLTGMDDPSVALAAKELGAAEVFRKDGVGHSSYAAVAARVRRVLTPVLSSSGGARKRSNRDQRRPSA